MESLLRQLADIERQSQDPTLSHSDQRLLDDAWADINDQIEVLDAYLNGAEAPPAEGEGPPLEDPEEWVDDRGCGNCAGCAYCMTAGGGYDEADEV